MTDLTAEERFAVWARKEWGRSVFPDHALDDSYGQVWKVIYPLMLQAFVRGMRHAADITAKNMGPEYEEAGYRRGYVHEVCSAAETYDPKTRDHIPLQSDPFVFVGDAE